MRLTTTQDAHVDLGSLRRNTTDPDRTEYKQIEFTVHAEERGQVIPLRR